MTAMFQPNTEGPSMVNPDLIADPRGGYGRLREEAPVVLGTSPDGSPAWFVTRQEDVRTVLADPRFVNNPTELGIEDVRFRMMEMIGVPVEYVPYLTDTILDVDGVDHVRLRKLVSRAFTVRRVTALRPRVEEIAAALLDGLAATVGAVPPGPVDLLADFAYPLPITVICELVGVPEADRPSWRRWGAAFATMDKETVPGAMREMVDHVHDLIARRRAEPRDDLLSGLVHAEEDGDRLTDTELVTMVLTLVLAGHETTAHLITGATIALLAHPDQLDRLRREPELWPGAVHELMRWSGPVLVTRLRYAVADLDLDGTRIAAGDAVQAVLVSANFDPREYADPERLDLTRRPSGRGEGHVGFGHGPHYCLGAALARQEAEVALRALFDRFPALALAVDEPAWLPVPGVRRVGELPVTLR
jgi:cytochrome P450